MRNSPDPTLHLRHPHPIPWSDMVGPIAQELGVPLVPYEQWLTALKDTSFAVGQQENPALRLLGFFDRVKPSKGREPPNVAQLNIEKALKVAPVLGDLPMLDAAEAQKWITAWKASGFLP